MVTAGVTTLSSGPNEIGNSTDVTTTENKRRTKKEISEGMYQSPFGTKNSGFMLEVKQLLNKCLNEKDDETTQKNVEKIVSNKDDFSSRLWNLYNKPITQGNRETSGSVRQKDVVGRSKQYKGKKNCFYDSAPPIQNMVNVIKCGNSEIVCKGLIGKYEGLNRKDEDEEALDSPLPSLNELPDDEEGLERLLKRYIEDIKPSLNRKKSGKPYPGGTKESVRNFDYRLADLRRGEDPISAATGGKDHCSCDDSLVIDGDSCTLKDINSKLKELRSNHKTTIVTIKMKHGSRMIDDEVDSKEKMKSFQRSGPALLTKYCLEKVCNQVGGHPCLTKLTVEKVPLPTRCQVMLVPSFATLRELRLIGNRLGDNGVKTICRYLWRSEELKVLDLTDNLIGAAGVRHLTDLIERRAVLKMLEAEHFGVERITLNNNPIGDDGFTELLNTVGKDLWLRALDVRNCNLRKSGEEALRIVTNNRDIEVLDMRDNRTELVKAVVKEVVKNSPPEKAEYKWYDMEDLQKYII